MADDQIRNNSNNGPQAAAGTTATTTATATSSGRKEIYTYQAPWPIYSLAWSSRIDPTSKFRLAIGSYMEQYSNSIAIIKQNTMDGTLYQAGTFDHPYPTTKLMFGPANLPRDIMATAGDYLRIWNIHSDSDSSDTNNNNNNESQPQQQQQIPGQSNVTVTKECLLNNNKTSEYCAHLTSFDWNETDPTMVGTSSIDTTCTIWDLHQQVAKTQLIAHDREVFDLAFARGKDVFASVGADGSVRMFDLRSLEHSTIIYESPNFDALLRLEWNKQDPNYLATFTVDSQVTILLDVRVPSIPVSKLGGHLGCLNSIAWAPHSSCHVCTAADDRQALIWDLSSMHKSSVEDPILAYTAGAEINNLMWSSAQPDWVSICFRDKLQVLRV